MTTGYLTLAEAAQLLDLSVETTRKAATRGTLVTERIGTMRVVTRDEVERYRREHLGRVGRPRKG